MSSNGRLTSKKTKVVDEFADRLWVLKLDGMHEAVTRFLRATAVSKKWVASGRRQSIADEMVKGNCDLISITEAADLLVEEAIALDPRLARKSSWRLSEPDNAIEGDAALIAQGEERCCLQRFKTRLSDCASVEPVRIVISTDTKHVTDDHAKAFIAAAKIAQQFRPLEIWWQGAWLIEETTEHGYKGHGFIFHVPLLNGDLDFARIQFVLSNQLRDNVSYQNKSSFAYNGVKPGRRIGTGAGVGEYSYLENTHHFVKESGISSDPGSIASVAAQWAGFEPLWNAAVNENEAVQYWYPAQPATAYTPPTEAERKASTLAWEKRQKELEREEKRLAAQRLAAAA